MVFVLLFGLVYLSLQLKFEEDITKLIPENEKSIILNKVLDQVDFADKIVIHLKVEEKGNVNELTQVATELVAYIKEECSDYITEVQGVVNDDDFEETLDFVYDNLPLFLTQEDYITIKQNTTREAIQKRTSDNYKTLISPSGFVARNTILKDPFGISFLGLQKLKELQVGNDFTIKNSFIITKDKKHLLLFLKPTLASNETDKNTAFVILLNSIKTKLNATFKNKVSIGYYGATVVAVANANQIKTDIQLTVSIALSVLFLILILFYKKISIPLILFVPTVFGALLAVTTLYLLRGTISAISIGIGSILLGITLDFSLHILTHYRNNTNVKELYEDVTKPIVMSSITTALAFLCLLFIKSRALQDLGIFAAVSVFGAAFFALLLIPHLYKPGKVKAKKSNFIDTIANFEFSKNKVLLTSCVLLFVVSVFTYNDVLFDKDISKMNYQTQELLDEEKALNSLLNTASKSLYVVAHGITLNEALSENQKVYTVLNSFKEQQKIISFSSVASVVLSDLDQQNKINNWNNFWSEDKQEYIQKELIASGQAHGFKTSTFNQFYSKLNNVQEVLSIEAYQEIKALNTKEYISTSENFYTVLSSLKVDETNADAIKSFFKGNKNVVVIDRKAMNETFLNGFKNNFNTLLGYSFIAVLIVLLFFFKRIELVLITILPIALTWLVTIGLMGMLGLSFNIFNIIISTFIFGLGVDYAIFMTNGLIKEYETGERHLPIYRTSIILSVITTILGVGVLIFAKHPALYSIALVCLLGILTALVVTFVIQPILFRGLITNRAKNGLAPLEFRKTIHSIISFTFYGLGGMLLSLFAITILKILPINKKAKFKWLHGVMGNLATSVLYSNPFVNKSVLLNKETFKKQAIIIANHTSFLDTLAIALVTPKVIFLVNDWVYKSPIFGQLAKVAGYYPVSSGVDGSLDHLKEKMNQGYSLIVFPEGKRMFSNKLGRFHKGAFFLAEELNLDVLPLYIHGNSEVLPKGDFIIYDGAITVKVGDRIAIDNPTLGRSVKEKTKNISKIFKDDFQKLRGQEESSTYFKKLVLSNFVYKSEAIYKSVKDDLDQNLELYHNISQLIELDAKLLHISNDYGQFDLLLNYYSNTRKITTFITEKVKATIAKNNFIGKDRTINYIDQLSKIFNIDTLLVTTTIDVSCIDLTSVKKIVILKESILTASLLEVGFSITKQNNTFIVLTRKI
ncbi:MAG: glycerol acyltransferase [Kordia sp.]|nr:MAG: glycerol acyltransferase [Kordia sp.]